MSIFERVYKNPSEYSVSSAVLNAGKRHERNHHYNAAILSYQCVLMQHPDYVPAMIGIANCKSKQKNVKKAIRYLKHCRFRMKLRPFRVECPTRSVKEQYRDYRECLNTLDRYIRKFEAKRKK